MGVTPNLSYSWLARCGSVHSRRTAKEAHFGPLHGHTRGDPGFEALNLFSAPPRTIRTLVKFGDGHERDRQGMPFDVGPISLSQGMVFEKEGKHVGIKQGGAHGLASSRSSRRRAYIPRRSIRTPGHSPTNRRPCPGCPPAWSALRLAPPRALQSTFVLKNLSPAFRPCPRW